MKQLIYSALGIIPLLLLSCGTTSPITDAQGTTVTNVSRKFSGATVQTFQCKVTKSNENLAPAQTYFADRITAEMKKSGGFTSVTRDTKPGADTLVIDGVITRYEEGNGTLRFMIGMGAGSAYFDSKVFFKDCQGKILGEMSVDKNSWVLGGAIAAAQTPQTFMDGAAKKIAEEARKFAK
jgi:hypothetical protein